MQFIPNERVNYLLERNVAYVVKRFSLYGAYTDDYLIRYDAKNTNGQIVTVYVWVFNWQLEKVRQ